MPRWPAKESWPREGSTCTVGVPVMKSWKRRPLIGRFAMASEFTVVVCVVADVSTSGEVTFTLIVSVTPPTCSVVSIVSTPPTFSSIVRSTVENDGSSVFST